MDNRPMRLESNLIDPFSMLMAIFMPSVISMTTTTAVSFMSSTIAVPRYKNGKTTAGYDQQYPEYH